MALFNGAFNLSGTAPDTIMVTMSLNGTPIQGSVGSSTFNSTSDISTIPVSALFNVTSVPATLQVNTNKAGFAASTTSLSVIRLSSGS